jgi:hypothetical protein
MKLQWQVIGRQQRGAFQNACPIVRGPLQICRGNGNLLSQFLTVGGYANRLSVVHKLNVRSYSTSENLGLVAVKKKVVVLNPENEDSFSPRNFIDNLGQRLFGHDWKSKDLEVDVDMNFSHYFWGLPELPENRRRVVLQLIVHALADRQIKARFSSNEAALIAKALKLALDQCGEMKYYDYLHEQLPYGRKAALDHAAASLLRARLINQMGKAELKDVISAVKQFDDNEDDDDDYDDDEDRDKHKDIDKDCGRSVLAKQLTASDVQFFKEQRASMEALMQNVPDRIQIGVQEEYWRSLTNSGDGRTPERLNADLRNSRICIPTKFLDVKYIRFVERRNKLLMNAPDVFEGQEVIELNWTIVADHEALEELAKPAFIVETGVWTSGYKEKYLNYWSEAIAALWRIIAVKKLKWDKRGDRRKAFNELEKYFVGKYGETLGGVPVGSPGEKAIMALISGAFDQLAAGDVRENLSLRLASKPKSKKIVLKQ